MKANPHPDQSARLKELYRYEILDTEREKDFDAIAELIAEICGTPISVVNLIDAERQWFKAEVGLGVRETPIETSICSHVILEEDFVEINDTLNDPRMCDNPLCLGDNGLRFYAGALLKGQRGLPLGTLCVLDYQPRSLTDQQRKAISILANQIMKLLDLRLALRREETLRREADHRVKNSLQSVAALTRLASRQAVSPEATSALDSVQRRVSVIAKLHEELYRQDAGPNIDLKAYLENVGILLSSMCRCNVTLSVDVDYVDVPSRQAAHAAIIVSEFVANSLKHGFPDGRAGRIDVCGRLTEDDVFHLVCRDDGAGVDDDHPALSLIHI